MWRTFVQELKPDIVILLDGDLPRKEISEMVLFLRAHKMVTMNREILDNRMSNVLRSTENATKILKDLQTQKDLDS